MKRTNDQKRFVEGAEVIQPSVSRTADSSPHLIPPMNRWAIVIRPLRGFDSLIDEVGESESHPLASLTEIVGVLIEKYERARAGIVG